MMPRCGGAKPVRREHDSAGCWPVVVLLFSGWSFEVPDVADKDCDAENIVFPSGVQCVRF
jgi:hypothetical protein